jgi:hypothetical protein
VLHIRQLPGIAPGIGQRPPEEGYLGREIPQFAIQFSKLLPRKVFKGLLQKRVVSVKVQAVKYVDKFFKRITSICSVQM